MENRKRPDIVPVSRFSDLEKPGIHGLMQTLKHSGGSAGQALVQGSTGPVWGGALVGFLFLAATELTINGSGVITVTQMVHTVDTAGDAASDNLDTINGGTTVGLIIIRPAHTDRTVVVRDGQGNIELQGGADISLGDITDHMMLFWDTTNSKWVDLGGGAVGIPTKIEDGTSKVEIESTNGPIVGTVAGVEAFHLSAIGVLTLAKQSGARVYRATSNQKLPNASETRVFFNAEDWDSQNEFNSASTDGTVHGDTSGTTLVATASIFASGDVGKAIWNTTDDTYTTITAYTNATTVTVADAIFATAETFTFYSSRFTAKEAGLYAVSLFVDISNIDDQTAASIRIKVNGNEKARLSFYNAKDGGAVTFGPSTAVSLSANDYVEGHAYHDTGNVEDIRYPNTVMSIVKVA